MFCLKKNIHRTESDVLKPICCPTAAQNPKDFPFAIIDDKEKRQSFALKKLEMANS